MTQNDYKNLPRYKVTPHFYKELWNHQHDIVKLTNIIGIQKMAQKLNLQPGLFAPIYNILEAAQNEQSKTYNSISFKELLNNPPKSTKQLYNELYLARNYIVHHINWVGQVTVSKELNLNQSKMSSVYNILKPQTSSKAPSDYRAPEHPDHLEFYHINNNLACMDDSAEIEHSKKDSYTKEEIEYLRRPKDDLTPQEVEYLRKYQEEQDHIRRGQYK